jgi:hypothetical protein
MAAGDTTVGSRPTESVARSLEPPREPSDCRVDEDLAALNLGELVPLAREEQVVDGNVPRTSYRHDLLGLADRHVRVVLAAHDERGARSTSKRWIVTARAAIRRRARGGRISDRLPPRSRARC